ncbi:MAG: BRO family protein [Alishewanella agri]|nr:BRO family protein [Alishewanella agri]
MANLLTTAQFEGVNLSIIDHNNQRWLTAEQIGLALGYDKENARKGINKLYQRHADEFTEEDKGVVELATPGGRQQVTIFSATGCHLLSFFSNTPRAKQFRAWAKQVLAGNLPVQAEIPEEDQLTVKDRLEMLEVATVTMAHHMKQLVQVSHQQAEKLDVTARYIGLLEINQKGKVKVTRQIEAKVLSLRAQGLPQADIARLLRISSTAVSQIVHGKYPFAAVEAAAPQMQVSIQEVLDEMVLRERNEVLRKIDGGAK